MLQKNSRKHSLSPNLTIVIKVGTSSICDEITHYPLLSTLSSIVETCVKLKVLGHRVVLVTSAAIGTGLRRLNLQQKPKKLSAIQAVAAVGQGRLMSLYDDLFGQFNQPVAQILLTRNDLADRSQYLNAVNCLMELLDMSVIPIINENDTISVSEIRFGDNDTLSAITAGMVNADYLFLLTDVDCLYTDNPRTNPDALPVEVVEDVAAMQKNVIVSSPGSTLGTGGMLTKLIAADLATAAGVTTVITRGATPQNILHIIDAHVDTHALTPSSPSNTPKLPLHTRFKPKPNPLVDRKWWIVHGLHSAGTILIDEGAVRAVTAKNRSSLFAAGIRGVEGGFVAQQAVKIVVERKNAITSEIEKVEIAKGLVNYSYKEIDLIKGLQSSEIGRILGFMDSECVIHRDNLVVTMKYYENEKDSILGEEPKLEG